MNKLLTFFAAATMISIAPTTQAARQTGAVTIDGSISDIDASVNPVQTVASSFGAGVCDLFNFRVSNDNTNLYIGVSSKFDGAGGTRGLWILIDSKSGGLNTLNNTTSQAGKLNGAVLESGMTADYIYYLQNGDGGNRQNYFLDVTDVQADSQTYYGVFDVNAGSFNANGAPPVGFAADVDNSESASNPSGAAGATKGFEFQIPLSSLGTTDSGASTIQVLVGSGDGGNAFWSSQTLPTSNNDGNLGGGAGNGSFPNFSTNIVGAFGTQNGFSGTQSQSMPLPVSLSTFGAE